MRYDLELGLIDGRVAVRRSFDQTKLRVIRCHVAVNIDRQDDW